MKKIIIISGANRGLGKALTDQYLAEANVQVISLSRVLNEEHTVYLKQGKLYFIPIDLKEQSIEQKLEIIKQFIEPGLKIVFINNASIINPINAVGFFEEQEIADIIAVNATAPIIISNYLLKHYKGHSLDFVNISSGAARRPIENWSLYCSSKAFVKMFFEVFQEENKENKKIRIFNVDPGVMDTAMQSFIRDAFFPEQKKFQELQDEAKLKTPEEAAEKIIKLIQ